MPAARYGFPSRMRQSDSVDCGGGGGGVERRGKDVRQIEKAADKWTNVGICIVRGRKGS